MRAAGVLGGGGDADKARLVSMGQWTAVLTGAGFAEVTAATIRAEAGLVTGWRPEHPVPPDHHGRPRSP